MPETASESCRADWSEARARNAAGPHLSVPGGSLPALQAVQAEFGHIPKAAIGWLAHEFNVSRAEVYGVVTFYHDFRLDCPAGKHILRLCRSEACQAVGGDELAACAKRELGLDWRETDASGEWTLEPVFCLGLCASGPSAMLDGEVVARLSPEKLCTIIGEAK